jgi:hypothetical protein
MPATRVLPWAGRQTSKASRDCAEEIRYRRGYTRRKSRSGGRARPVTLQRWPPVPEINEHLVSEIYQQPDQCDVVDDHDNLAHHAMRQQPNRQPRDESENHDRSDDGACVMNQQLDRVEVDPLLDIETVG